MPKSRVRRYLGDVKFRSQVFATKVELELSGRFGRRRVDGGGDVIVSMTTHGSRIRECHLALESIMRGSVRPGRLILWLSRDDLDGPLPAPLMRLARRGLEVLCAENLGPHTKYFPALELVTSEGGALITADDDVLYPRYWLQRMLSHHGEHPDDVVCYRARVMRFDTPSTLAPYGSWPYAKATNHGEGPLFVTGVSGALYPLAMVEALKSGGRDFLSACPSADDIWLTRTAHKAGLPIRIVGPDSRDFPSVDGVQSFGLKHHNVAEYGNDRQLKMTFSESDLRELSTRIGGGAG